MQTDFFVLIFSLFALSSQALEPLALAALPQPATWVRLTDTQGR